jgi:hypothetical protein
VVPFTRSFYHHEGIQMKRFVLFFASLVLSIQAIGCGGDASTSNPAADDPSKWGEAKKSQAKRDADIAERVKAAAAKKGRWRLSSGFSTYVVIVTGLDPLAASSLRDRAHLLQWPCRRRELIAVSSLLQPCRVGIDTFSMRLAKFVVTILVPGALRLSRGAALS